MSKMGRKTGRKGSIKKDQNNQEEMGGVEEGKERN